MIHFFSNTAFDCRKKSGLELCFFFKLKFEICKFKIKLPVYQFKIITFIQGLLDFVLLINLIYQTSVAPNNF